MQECIPSRRENNRLKLSLCTTVLFPQTVKWIKVWRVSSFTNKLFSIFGSLHYTPNFCRHNFLQRDYTSRKNTQSDETTTKNSIPWLWRQSPLPTFCTLVIFEYHYSTMSPNASVLLWILLLHWWQADTNSKWKYFVSYLSTTCRHTIIFNAYAIFFWKGFLNCLLRI